MTVVGIVVEVVVKLFEVSVVEAVAIDVEVLVSTDAVVVGFVLVKEAVVDEEAVVKVVVSLLQPMPKIKKPKKVKIMIAFLFI